VIEPVGARLPLGVITGFLGSGKTTLLNRLLHDPRLADSAVPVNELGEIGLDHWLIEPIDAETVLLPSGCVCCTVRAELRDALIELWTKRAQGLLPPFRRVILETTGLADPAPIAQTLAADPRLRHHFRLGTIVTVVDALTGPATILEHDEAVHQVAAADLLAISKLDLAAPEVAEALEGQLTAINPAAEVTALSPDGPVTAVGNAMLAATLPHAAHTRSTVHHEHLAHGRVGAVCLTTDEPLDWAAFAVWFTLLLHRHGRNVLRGKGILNLRGVTTPVVVHGVQHVVHRPYHLASWPEGRPLSRLVLIGKDLPSAQFRRSFEAFVRPGQTL
jgi:G3E family GTPase